MAHVRLHRTALGKATVALSVIALVLAGTLGLLLVAPQSIVHSETTTTTVTTTLMTSLETTTIASLGAETQCGFTQTCGAMSTSGLELILSVNSTSIRPNSTLAITVTELNTLSKANNVSSASEWRMPGLTWGQGCGGPGYLPHGIELFKGYYTIDNVTSAKGLPFWGSIPCGVASIIDIGNVTSYAFQPNSDNASYSAMQSNVLKGYPPSSMLFSNNIYAGYVPIAAFNQISSASSTYTLAAGDEWGALILLHFSVASF
jgi:hypothetical protein